MIKVVQPASKPISGIVGSTMSGQTVRIFKSPNHQESLQVHKYLIDYLISKVPSW